jgi:6-phosphofructokinase 1
MGRHAGYLALYVGISVGATAVLIPERPLDFERDIVEKIRRARLSGTTHYMIVVAEGAGNAVDISNRIREEVGIDPRVTVLGHIQRGGAPSARDRETASRMAYEAVMSLIENRGNRVIAAQNGQLVGLDMEEALQMKKPFQMDRYEILESLSSTKRNFF